MGCCFCVERSRKTLLIRPLIESRRAVREFTEKVSERGELQAVGTGRLKVQNSQRKNKVTKVLSAFCRGGGKACELVGACGGHGESRVRAL